MATICCYDAQGNAVSIASEAVIFRPAVYGIFIENKQVVLLRHAQTKLWQPPGAILASHEIPIQAVRHYFRQVTGITPLLGPLLFVENQYWIDDGGQAWHLSALYYALDRPMAMTTTLVELENSARPEWVPLEDLHRNQLQFGYEAIQAGWLRLKL